MFFAQQEVININSRTLRPSQPLNLLLQLVAFLTRFCNAIAMLAMHHSTTSLQPIYLNNSFNILIQLFFKYHRCKLFLLQVIPYTIRLIIDEVALLWKFPLSFGFEGYFSCFLVVFIISFNWFPLSFLPLIGFHIALSLPKCNSINVSSHIDSRLKIFHALLM